LTVRYINEWHYDNILAKEEDTKDARSYAIYLAQAGNPAFYKVANNDEKLYSQSVEVGLNSSLVGSYKIAKAVHLSRPQIREYESWIRNGVRTIRRKNKKISKLINRD
jgi:hypothetical protein